MLYLMCLQYRDGGSYNGYLIDDILIDKYNFNKQLVLLETTLLHAHFGSIIHMSNVFI